MPNQTSDPTLTEAAAAFLKEDYDHKIAYLKDHFSRMWTRFNYFVGIETAITGGKILWAGEEVSADWFAWLGVVVSLFWYMMGAQDRYQAERYREQMQAAGEQLANHQGLTQYTPIGTVSNKTFDFRSLAEWRSRPFSTTRLAAWIPLVVMVLWLALAIGSMLEN